METKQRTTDEDVHAALQKIVDNSDSKALNWCVNYARAGLDMTGETLRVQCLYVLNNMVHWRGETGNEVRGTLKRYIKQSRGSNTNNDCSMRR